ncbi:MAG: hypothetical protein U0746_19330 [Gemmataceae bacterium]
MRRLLAPVRTPVRRAALVAAAAFLLLLRYAPYPPRYCAPTSGFLPIGFSPDGRQLALHNWYLHTDLSSLLFGKVVVHDLTAGGPGERCVEVNLYMPRPPDEPFPLWPLWEYLRDPSIRRRLLAQVYGDAALGPDEGGWPSLGVVDASADRRYWAYQTVGGQPDVGAADRAGATQLVVRGVATGRVAVTTDGDFLSCAFGPGPDLLTTVHLVPAAPTSAYRIDRWNLTTGQRVTPPGWPQFPERPALTADGRYAVAFRLAHPPESQVYDLGRVYDLDDGGRFVRSLHFPIDRPAWLDSRWVRGHSFVSVATGGGDGPGNWLEIDSLARDRPLTLRATADYAFWPAGLAPDGTRAAIAVMPRGRTSPLPDWLVDLADRTGINLQAQSQLWLLDTASGRVIAELGGNPDVNGSIPSAVFSDDGRQLAFVGSGVLHVYDLPLHRPWHLIAAWTALATGVYAMFDLGVCRWRRRHTAG